LDAAARLRLSRQIGVDDRIGNPVANLVGMALRYRLAGKNKILLRQRPSPFKQAPPITRGCRQRHNSDRDVIGPCSGALLSNAAPRASSPIFPERRPRGI